MVSFGRMKKIARKIWLEIHNAVSYVTEGGGSFVNGILTPHTLRLV